MNPRLIAVEGPLKGETAPLAADGLTIGRAPTNSLVLADASISRQHCEIASQSGRFVIRDLDSQNGTSVNGLPVRERTLAHGDEIQIGRSRFQFIDAEQLSSIAVFADAPAAANTVVLTGDESVPLKAMLALGTALASIGGVEQLQRKLLESALEAIPAGRGAVLLAEDGSVVTWYRGAGHGEPFPLSRDVADRVLQERAAALSPGIAAAPLISRDRALGLIYLDSPVSAFTRSHLELLTAIAAIGAVAIDNAGRFETLRGDNERLEAEIRLQHQMVGQSAAMRKVYDFIARVAPSESTVLIGGESGTGKELVARAIHRNSPRAAGPFVAINCAALTESLLESELFGHERGAFTGAVGQKKGKLEAANGGTVFLDEIGELAPVLQAKLLRVLQVREFDRVGGTRPVKVDVRVVAATNKRLDEEAAAGRFRQDLYYRLNVVSVVLPPLRERREDIRALAAHFVARFSEQMRRKIEGISPEALKCVMRYDWPGNVRELENAMERAVVLGTTDAILPEDLPEAVVEAEPEHGEEVSGYHEAVREAKKQLIRRCLEQSGGNHAAAARLLGVHPKYLFRLIRNLNLRND